MYRYKVLLADDESEILYGISDILQHECKDIEIAACCNNGSQVLDYLQKNPVDIVISDISMPVVTGIEIAKYVHDRKLDTIVILITGYRKFEYAVDAIRFNVTTFITKPIDFDELLGAVERAKHTLADKRMAAVQASRSLLKDRDAQRVHLLMFTSGLYDGMESLAFSGIDLKQTPCALIEFESREMPEPAEEHDFVWQYMCEIDDADKNVFCLQENELGATLLVLFKFTDRARMLATAEQYAEGILRLMKSACKITAVYKISYYSTVRDVSARNFDSLAGLYVDYLSKNNFAAKSDFLNIIHSSFNFEMMKNFLLLVVGLVKGIGIPAEQIYASVSRAHTKQDLLDILQEIDRLVKADANHSDDRIVAIKNYISNHFNSNISLLSVADAFHLNPSYLSRIFKNTTGIRIGDYIMSIRMEKAKQLLSNKAHDISEVSMRVGYNNPAYFSKIFKDYTGVTPAQYQSFGREDGGNANQAKGK